MPVGVHILCNIFECQSVGSVVVILSPFIFYCGSLYFKLGLCYSIKQKTHAVGFQPNHFFQLVAGHRLKIIGAVAVGRAIEGTTAFRYNFEMLFITNMVAALEHHMFKKMGEAGLADFFPCRTYMVSNIHMCNRVAMVFMND